MGRYTGKLITFEGIEKCGKSTLIKFANDHLMSKGLSTACGREPGTDKVAEDIRGILLNKEHKGKLANLTELALYEAARSQYVEYFVIPNLKAKNVVLSDRYYHSTLAYQGYGRGIPPEVIENLNNYFAHQVHPDLTFIVDIPVEVMLERIKKGDIKKDRIESEKKEFHETVRNAYLRFIYDYENCVLIDNSGPIEKAQAALKEHLDSFIEKHFKAS